MADERLIESVRNYPCLWQVSSHIYRDLRAKENAWAKVAEEVNITLLMLHACMN